MTDRVLPSVLAGLESERPPGVLEGRDERVRRIVTEHYGFLWRLLRRLGVPEADVEDAAQKALWVVARRIDDVTRGKERTFLFGVALRVARSARNAVRARRDVPDADLLAELPAEGPDAGERLDAERARRLLDAILDALPLELRTVFVLYEIEELTMLEIAGALDLPAGTVASRLRRAREAFEVASRRVQSQRRTKGPAR